MVVLRAFTRRGGMAELEPLVPFYLLLYIKQEEARYCFYRDKEDHVLKFLFA